MEARVTLRPGSKGTKKLTAEFGDRLVCVRYRYDIERRRRYKTVEIIVDEADWQPVLREKRPPAETPRPREIVGIRVGYEERILQRAVREAGGKWDSGMRLWLMPRTVVNALGIEGRIVRGAAWFSPTAFNRRDLHRAGREHPARRINATR